MQADSRRARTLVDHERKHGRLLEGERGWFGGSLSDRFFEIKQFSTAAENRVPSERACSAARCQQPITYPLGVPTAETQYSHVTMT
jgi:hypothetical protein